MRAVDMRLALTSWALSAVSSLLGPELAVNGVNDGVEVRLAGDKGLGAFAQRDLPAGAYLGRYTGRLYSADGALAALNNGDTSGNYFATLQNAPGDGPLVIDAEDYEISGWPRFINHSLRRQNCRNTELGLPLVDGVDVRIPLGLYVQTIRDIKAGEELLVDYGPEYWTDRGLAPGTPRRLMVDYL